MPTAARAPFQQVFSTHARALSFLLRAVQTEKALAFGTRNVGGKATAAAAKSGGGAAARRKPSAI